MISIIFIKDMNNTRSLLTLIVRVGKPVKIGIADREEITQKNNIVCLKLSSGSSFCEGVEQGKNREIWKTENISHFTWLDHKMLVLQKAVVQDI